MLLCETSMPCRSRSSRPRCRPHVMLTAGRTSSRVCSEGSPSRSFLSAAAWWRSRVRLQHRAGEAAGRPRRREDRTQGRQTLRFPHRDASGCATTLLPVGGVSDRGLASDPSPAAVLSALESLSAVRRLEPRETVLYSLSGHADERCSTRAARPCASTPCATGWRTAAPPCGRHLRRLSRRSLDPGEGAAAAPPVELRPWLLASRRRRALRRPLRTRRATSQRSPCRVRPSPSLRRRSSRRRRRLGVES